MESINNKNEMANTSFTVKKKKKTYMFVSYKYLVPYLIDNLGLQKLHTGMTTEK